MSKLVNDIKGFFKFFNELRKSRPWTFYSFITFFALGIAAAVGGVLLLGATPAMALMIAFGGLYFGVVVGYLANLSREGMEMTAWRQKNFLQGLNESHPILFWGLLASLILVPAVAALFVFVPSLAALVTGSAIANYLGITAALSTNILWAEMAVIGIWAGIAASFALQGLVDIAKDINSGLKWCFTSNKGFQTHSDDDVIAYYYMPGKKQHPATAYSHGKPVFGAGGAPAAAETTATASYPAPHFSLGGSGNQS